MNRWSEYTKDRFDDARDEDRTINFPSERPPTLKDENTTAMNEMGQGKAPGQDNITIEMIEALGEYGVEQLMILHVFNNIYNTGKISEEMLKSEFITSLSNQAQWIVIKTGQKA